MRDLQYWWYRGSWALAHKDYSAGIPVGSWLPSRREKEVSIPNVVAALRRVAEGDPHRFRRIQRQVSCIQLIGTRLIALGGWFRPLSMILLPDDWLELDSTSAERVALTIVHEATHARLSRFGYGPEIRARIERICQYQELVFASRIGGDSELVAGARRGMDLNPSEYTTETRRQRSLEALTQLGLPKWMVRLLDRVTKRRAA